MDIKNKDEFKSHILTTYMASQRHAEPVPNYNLEALTGYGYALYKRNGRHMYLVDVFPSYEEANQQAQDIVNEYQELKNYLIHKKSEHKS
ncbi:hypothetical protein [Xenorhabdus sp. SGI240]|uniref:hypothetical protein n=1 Tax=Xenorhabdus sp. SGI240 TaxID=3158262 RepID=UPI0032B8534C